MKLNKSLLVLALMLCGCSGGNNVNGAVDYDPNKEATSDQFNFDGNYTPPELKVDGLKDYKEWYNGKKDVKASKKFPLLNIAKWAIVYGEFMKDPQEKLVKTEWQEALTEVWFFEDLVIDNEVSKFLKKNIQKFAWSIDEDTNKKLTDNFNTILTDWLSFEEGKRLILNTFEELKTTRADLIVRTETIRAWNYASELGWKQSGVVEKKQRYTALDERVCEFCWPMNWKIVGINEKYFNKWTVMIWADWHELKLDYSDTPYPPLHPKCRCVIVPVID